MTNYPLPNDFVPSDLDALDWDQLEPLYTALVERELRCAGCLQQLLLDRSELDAAASEAQANVYIRMTCHTDDEDAKNAFLHFVEHVEPKLKDVSFRLDRRIVQCPFVDDLDQERYGVYLRNLDADVKLFREENIPLQTDDTKLGQQYDEVCGAMTVEFDGEEYTMPQMGRFVQENDRSVRERAWSSIMERRYRDHEPIDGFFDRMVSIRDQVARNADHENYMEYAFAAMHRFDYTPADCQEFHRAAREICVPIHHELNRERARLLEVDVLRPWDLEVDVHGRAPLRPFDGADELVDRTSRLFHRMDGSLGEMFDTMRGGDSLDLESRKGKAPGGYQYNRDRRRVPFIFMNAAGLQRDLVTMVHEAGHAFHSILSRDEPLVAYRHAPIEFAEVASMSMELLAHPFLEEFYDEEAANRARRAHLEDLVRTLSWIAQIDAFQHWIYTHPEHTSEQRDIYWLELDALYGADVSWEGFEAQRAKAWHRQLHLFNVPFYYIEYGIAQLGALQLWMQYRQDRGQAIENYRRAMTLGGSRPLPELFEAAELTFDFGPGTMKRLMDEVQGELATLPA
ncbi:MAG: M3 family oligoendopeptidase [Planctomycetota bacterium]|nr:M3 family oligoendopeptidase [Planctomycetota bacterium]|tara:strand:- start:8605 stop:10311 length:1707 start_codon:yes stop_codon:yes gene_type:complete